MLSARGHPELRSLGALLESLGLRLAVEVHRHRGRTRPAARSQTAGTPARKRERAGARSTWREGCSTGLPNAFTDHGAITTANVRRTTPPAHRNPAHVRVVPSSLGLLIGQERPFGLPPRMAATSRELATPSAFRCECSSEHVA